MNGKGCKTRSGFNRARFHEGYDRVFGTRGAPTRCFRPRVYISGPISLGDRQHNLDQSLHAHRVLIEAGLAPINPILTMLCPWENEIKHDDWLEVDYPWVLCSDAVMRLPGESEGADKEVALAGELYIPVFHHLSDCIDYFKHDLDDELLC